jgi:ABC-2 type transport system permease protein
MTTESRTRTAGRQSAPRIASLARGEALLLRRNPVALLVALATPVAMVLMTRAGVPDPTRSAARGAAVVTSLTAFALLFVVYYNLVTALVARREELVLKRLRTGETSDAEILAGTAAPAVAIAWGQLLIGALVAVAAFGLGRPTNPALVLAAILLGTAVFVLLALASTALTQNVEMAQLTTTPVLVAPLALSGLLFPTDLLPESLQRLGQLLPLTPVVDLLRLGLTGTTTQGASVDLAASLEPAVGPLLVLAGWVVVGVWATRRWFRWEPRR